MPRPVRRQRKQKQEAYLETTVGHPNTKDLENAKGFGKSLIE